jgi:hypothetical protein
MYRGGGGGRTSLRRMERAKEERRRREEGGALFSILVGNFMILTISSMGSTLFILPKNLHCLT